MSEELPLVLEPAELARHLEDERLLIVDLSKDSVHGQAHIPGAVHLDFSRLVCGEQPVPGLPRGGLAPSAGRGWSCRHGASVTDGTPQNVGNLRNCSGSSTSGSAAPSGPLVTTTAPRTASVHVSGGASAVARQRWRVSARARGCRSA